MTLNLKQILAIGSVFLMSLGGCVRQQIDPIAKYRPNPGDVFYTSFDGRARENGIPKSVSLIKEFYPQQGNEVRIEVFQHNINEQGFYENTLWIISSQDTLSKEERPGEVEKVTDSLIGKTYQEIWAELKKLKYP